MKLNSVRTCVAQPCLLSLAESNYWVGKLKDFAKREEVANYCSEIHKTRRGEPWTVSTSLG